mmetsp:Transcript_11894/g.32981  ORF Transcript_11894/g.32981 Transcript_11894/m.32981 type:complete len:200 (+) Transcript_11894:929-1528(+)
MNCSRDWNPFATVEKLRQPRSGGRLPRRRHRARRCHPATPPTCPAVRPPFKTMKMGPPSRRRNKRSRLLLLPPPNHRTWSRRNPNGSTKIVLWTFWIGKIMTRRRRTTKTTRTIFLAPIPNSRLISTWTRSMMLPLQQRSRERSNDDDPRVPATANVDAATAPPSHCRPTACWNCPIESLIRKTKWKTPNVPCNALTRP